MDEDSDRQFSGAELEERVAEIQAPFRAVGHPLSDKALDRCGRILSGDISYEEAIDEISHDRIPLRLHALAQNRPRCNAKVAHSACAVRDALPLHHKRQSTLT